MGGEGVVGSDGKHLYGSEGEAGGEAAGEVSGVFLRRYMIGMVDEGAGISNGVGGGVGGDGDVGPDEAKEGKTRGIRVWCRGRGSGKASAMTEEQQDEGEEGQDDIRGDDHPHDILLVTVVEDDEMTQMTVMGGW